jgi:uncharacterized iron-regulated membrane protein
MKKLFRDLMKVHRWAAWLAALPALLILGTGLLLSLRQNISWMQPAIQQGTPGLPTLSMTAAFEIARKIPEAGIDRWKDLKSIEVKPGAGVICLRAANGYEVQLDGGSGEILSVAPRRTAFLVTLHEGTFFHPVVRWGFIFPAALALLVLACTGIGLLGLPYLRKIKGEK